MPIDPSCPIVPRLVYWRLCLPLQMQTIVSSVVWCGVCVCVCTLDTYFYLAILAKSHYLLYNLVCAMYPRFLITLDETLATKPVMVRVGQVSVHVLDVVGQAGRPKAITGFQTHTTPVLLAHSERAELATEECKLLFWSTRHRLTMIAHF
jgi:26S proteasome regulatory subunit N1